MQIGLEVKGVRQLEKKLHRLDRTAAKKIVRAGIRKGGNIVLKKARSNAATMVGGNMGGLLKKHLVLRSPKRQRSGQYCLVVNLRPGVKEFIHIAQVSRFPDKKTFIPAAIEYGHDNVAAIPFTRSAFYSEGKRSIATAKSEIENQVQAEFKK